MVRASIRVRGAWAELEGGNEETLEEVLAFDHPAPYRSQAYRDKLWDGKLRLFSGTRFPAGLAPRVADHITEHQRRDVALHGWQPKTEVDWSWVDEEYLPPVGKFKKLWPHQLDAIRAFLANPRGIGKLPTGSGKTEIVAAVARLYWDEFGWRSLVLVPKLGLLHQTAHRLVGYYQGEVSVGIIGDGQRAYDCAVTVATAQTMARWRPSRVKGKLVGAERELRNLLQEVRVLFLDECHRASSETWYDIAMNCKAVRRYGLSGTPLKADAFADAKMIGATGPILYTADADTLISTGLAAKPKIVMVYAEAATGPDLTQEVHHEALKLTREQSLQRQLKKKRSPKRAALAIQRIKTPDPKLRYQVGYRLGIVENKAQNAAVVRGVQWLAKNKRRTLVLCRQKKHLALLVELFEQSGVSYISVEGASDLLERKHAKQALAGGKVQAVIATTIWDEGEDLECDAIILAEGVKSLQTTLQRIGRGMRRDSTDVWVIDFVPTATAQLREQAAHRADAYESEGYEVMLIDKWPSSSRGKLELPFTSWDVLYSAQG